MNYLLDTHTFIWSFLNTANLSQKVYDIISDSENKIFVSVTSFWEIAIKMQKKKMNLGGIHIMLLPNIAKNYDFEILNPDSYDYVTYTELPQKENHKDPFDRMLIHTAIRNNLVLLSKDQFFPQYEADGLQLLW